MDERLERIEQAPDMVRSIRSLRLDTTSMIAEAEADHAAF